MNLVLIGYRCSGKSTVSDLAGRAVGWPVFHVDREIAASAQKPIVDIVRDDGWERFREIERQVVRHASQRDRHVIDPGGSVVMNRDNVAALRSNGCVVWLKTSAGEIRVRMETSEERLVPLTAAATALEEVEEMLGKLDGLYAAAADHVIETDRKSTHQVTGDVIRILALKNDFA